MFLPIEPPRPPPNKRESYARRSHQFSPSIDEPGKPGLFRKASVAAANPSVPSLQPPSISIDCRLPDPAIITCDESLPLRILITKKNESPATIFLRTLSITLIGFTSIRAQDLRKQEAQSCVIVSQAHIDKALNSTVGGDGNKVSEVDSIWWKQRLLPNIVSPSFTTCNISRRYELEVKAGLSWGSTQNIYVGLDPFTWYLLLISRSLSLQSKLFECLWRSTLESLHPKPCSTKWRDGPFRNLLRFLTSAHLALQIALPRGTPLDLLGHLLKRKVIILSLLRQIFLTKHLQAMKMQWRMI